MKFKLGLFSLLLAVLAVLLFGCLTLEKSETARRGGGARIEVIDGWELKDDARTSKGQIACIKPIGKNLPQVDLHTSLSLKDTGDNITPSSVANMFKDAFVKQGATLVSEGDTKLGGLDAKQFTVTYGDKKSKFIATVYWERPFWLIFTALASEFDSYKEDFEKLADKVSFYPLTDYEDQWIKLEGKPLGEIVSPLGEPEDLDHIETGGYAEDWNKDGKIDGIAIAIDFLAKDQTIGKIMGWYNTRFVVDVKLIRKDTKQVVYSGTHYGISWLSFPVVVDPPENCWIPKEKIKGGFDPAKDMGKFILEISVKTEKQGTFTAKDQNCPHPSKRGKK